ncbi:MAG: cysteine hydrolase [Theionarchaea archaeon]|nr:MAG: hypothetical protein AYK18_08835 [Theionarchaea archaeon DG-70]MBU7012632.1 cysteine hydrolase [Theionarchaea archaeon]
MKTIIEEWEKIELPPPPVLTPVTVNSRETALLILDIQNQNCNQERRPRCVKSIQKIKKLLQEARENKMVVVYSLIRSGQKEDIRKEVKPEEGEKIVKAGVDKFYQTELESILTENHIKKVILVGTSAHGAVLHTATGAAARNYEVIIPVDGMSADSAYPEQYTVWHIAHSPGTKRHATLTRSDLITIG